MIAEICRLIWKTCTCQVQPSRALYDVPGLGFRLLVLFTMGNRQKGFFLKSLFNSRN